MNTPTIGSAKFCPSCHSPSVEYGAILTADAPAKCNACDWTGKMEELLTTRFVHEMGSAENTLRSLANDLRGLMAKDCGVFIGLFLRRWGFLPDDQKEASRVLAKYISNIAKAMLTSIIKTRQELEQDRVRHEQKSP